VINLNNVQVGDVVEAEAVVLVKVAADRGVQLQLVYDDGDVHTMNGSSVAFDATGPGGSNPNAGFQVVTIKGAFLVTDAAPLTAIYCYGSFNSGGSGSPEVNVRFIKMESYRP
jgi:hypothetical protein